MNQSLANIAFLVREYEEAIEFFTRKLSFKLIEDRDMGSGKRWVVVQPPGEVSTGLLLARASNPRQLQAIGNQAGGRVFLFLQTDDFWRDYHAMQARGVQFAEAPREEAYGIVAVFLDLYGNRWDLLELHTGK